MPRHPSIDAFGLAKMSKAQLVRCAARAVSALESVERAANNAREDVVLPPTADAKLTAALSFIRREYVDAAHNTAPV